jgi:TPR repeat protein
MDLYTRAADLGYKDAHHNLAGVYHEGGDLMKAKFHYFSFFESPPSS